MPSRSIYRLRNPLVMTYLNDIKRWSLHLPFRDWHEIIFSIDCSATAEHIRWKLKSSLSHKTRLREHATDYYSLNDEAYLTYRI